MNKDNYAFLTDELRKALSHPDPSGNLQLILIQYHEALLQAIEDLHLCITCAHLDLRRLKTNANDLRQSEFSSVYDLRETFKSRLRDLIKLCPVCRNAFQNATSAHFFVIHTRTNESTKKGREED